MSPQTIVRNTGQQLFTIIGTAMPWLYNYTAKDTVVVVLLTDASHSPGDAEGRPPPPPRL